MPYFGGLRRQPEGVRRGTGNGRDEGNVPSPPPDQMFQDRLEPVGDAGQVHVESLRCICCRE